MTEPENSGELSAEQQDTKNLLKRLLGQMIADRYVDFCRLASGIFELRVSRPVAAHALRELESILRESLKASLEVRTSENPIDPLLAPAEKALLELGFDKAVVKNAVEKLKPQTHAAEIGQIIDDLGLASDGDVAKAWISLCKNSGKAHERSFHQSLVVDEDFREKFQRSIDTVLRAVALALQRRFSTLMLRVEKLSKMPNKKQATKLFRAEVPGAMSLQRHFFERLETADWLPHLKKQKLLGPPLSELDTTSVNTWQVDEWPAGSYLRRMAKSDDPEARRQVKEAVRNVATSKHPAVSRGGLEIIAALPATEAASLVDVAAGWLDSGANFITLQPAEKLVKQLAKGGEPAAALTVASRLLQIFGDQGDIETLYAQNMYEHNLPQLVPALTDACGVKALELFSDLLYQAAVVSRKVGDGSTFDYTSFDQSPLTEDSTDIYSVYDALKCQVQRSAKQIIAADPHQMLAVIDVFSRHSPKLFRRLAMVVLAQNPAAMPERAKALLMDAELVEASWCKHEYASLALAWFPSLTLLDQKTVLQQVDAIPERHRADWKAGFEEHEQRPPDAENERAFSASMVRNALWYWRAALPADRQAEVEAIVAEFGDPDSWRPMHRMRLRQEESPLATVDFATPPVLEIAEFLSVWQPGEEPQRHTVTALAQELRNAAFQYPLKYAQGAMDFADLPAIYVHQLLEGLCEAAKKQRAFPWASVLPLLSHTLSRLNEPVDTASVAEGNDPNWQWACTAGGELLKAGLSRGATGIGYEHKAAVQNLVLELQHNAPREPELEDFEEWFERDPYLASEATLPGVAIELCMLFIFWLSKETKLTDATTPREAFALTPEIRAALETALADRSSSGRIPRAILGRYLRRLHHFGENWLAENMAQLFPQENDSLRRAAWLGHLLHDSGPLGAKLEHLRGDYAREIELLADTSYDREESRQKRLGYFLLHLYLDEHLDFEPGTLLDNFLTKSSAKLRRHIMWHLGTEYLKQPISELQRTRALAYCDSRLAAGETASDHAGFMVELRVIGQWCENHQIEPTWLLDQLLRMLRSGFFPEIAYRVVEWLAKVWETHVDRAVEVLEKLLVSTNHAPRDYLIGQDESIRALLEKGISHGTDETRKRVGDLVSYLASINQPGYLDLVRSGPVTGTRE